MARRPKPDSIAYVAKDFLDGTEHLSPMEELAYRRICDFIYSTGDRLEANDEALARSTKTGADWPAVRAALVRKGKIKIVRGWVKNERCSIELGTKSHLKSTRSASGKRGAEARWKKTPESHVNALSGNAEPARAEGWQNHKPDGKRIGKPMPRARASSSRREEEIPLSTTRLDTPRPPPDGKPSELVAVVDAACFEFYQRSRAPHHADAGLARDWAARGLTPEALRSIVEPAIGKRATAGGDMPVSLKFFANAVATFLDGGGAAAGTPPPEVAAACRAYTDAVEAWSRAGKEGPSPKPEAFGIELVDGRFRPIARAA